VARHPAWKEIACEQCDPLNSLPRHTSCFSLRSARSAPRPVVSDRRTLGKEMIIRDDNTLEDIHGLILTLSADVSTEKPEFPIRPRMEELVTRIEEKLKRNTNTTRANWFAIALSYAKDAQVQFERGERTTAATALQRCWEHLESGNKAHRRKATFIVTPDGTVLPK
jgi:hypothetical protein